MNDSDLIRLRHMLDAAREAQFFAEGKTRFDPDSDRGLAIILVHEIVLIGEAAARVTQDFQGSHIEIEWKNIIGMRNRLIHAYFEIDLDIVWNTVLNRLPKLIEQLETIFSNND
jgi:uncharacterized protein with HEPN domain